MEQVFRQGEAPRPVNGYDPRLDSLRGLSALAIIPFHWGVLHFGWIGVQVFFVLSGMLITGSLLKSKSRIPSFSQFLLYFLEKRVLRLFPLYYLFLVLLTLFFLAVHWPPSFLRDAPYLFTYGTNLLTFWDKGADFTCYSHLWSLGVEWQFYLPWPFVIWLLTERQVMKLALVIVILGPLLDEATYWTVLGLTHEPVQAAQVCYRMPWTQAGALALGALLVRPQTVRILAKGKVWVAILAVCAAAGAAVIHFGRAPLGTLGYPSPAIVFHQFAWGYTLLNLLAACAIALTIQRSRLTSFADIPQLQYLGKISYGIYVIHLPLVFAGLYFLGRERHSSAKALIIFIILVAATLGLAHLSFQYYESWFLRKKSKLRETETRPGPVTPTLIDSAVEG
jgi:peptidoglycan/LPS O-acetylase OafA/YrhL